MPIHDAHEVLTKLELTNVTLTNKTGSGSTRTIQWTQVSRHMMGNSEKYQECEYEAPNGHRVKVFVADAVCNNTHPPDSFNTSGYNGMLHMGILNLETDANAVGIFFVIHPKDWKPYQHRFKTDTLTGFLHKAAGSGAGAMAGAAAGSCVPIAGTIIGGAVGAVVGSFFAPSIFGDYLHFLG